ncbi:6-phosphofructokinase [Lacticaseibacillus jixiensis]|uniref:6-phosphofructokinase n=1 Tax=Lacticaseibacillus jixiensis TaxID=3231926 RepID=UPI0036F40B40
MTKLLVVHGGGPTAVMNASLFGILAAARAAGVAVAGAKFGIAGIQSGAWQPLPKVPSTKLLTTPGSVLGSSRTPLTDADYPKLAACIHHAGFSHVLMTGGNGTQATARRLAAAGVAVIGVPKTIDNDLVGVDHAPGYLSAARFVAATVQEIAADVAALPIHVVIVEVMGRNAGWLAAAASLAQPDLLYLPEQAFDEAVFLAQVEAIAAQRGGALVVVPEGLRDAEGQLVGVSPQNRYAASISAYLANLVMTKLHRRARSEKPGLAGRASIAWQAPRDQAEAVAVGKAAVAAALAGTDGVMVGLTHGGETPLLPLTQCRGQRPLAQIVHQYAPPWRDSSVQSLAGAAAAAIGRLCALIEDPNRQNKRQGRQCRP